MGKVITIKNNKGGVGKSWLTLQLAHIIALILEGKKVLILTSDSQNNILLYANVSVPVISGLEDHVLKGDGDIISLRENLYYIPLIKNNFTKRFREKLRVTIDEFKKEYDYILIDSVPVLNIDQDFVELSDKVVIPTFLDAATTEGITKLMGEIDIDKIAAIVPNRYTKTKVEQEWYEDIAKIVAETNIYLSEPIKQSAVITELIQKGKTILETQSKKAVEFQDIIGEIAGVILREEK